MIRPSRQNLLRAVVVLVQAPPRGAAAHGDGPDVHGRRGLVQVGVFFFRFRRGEGGEGRPGRSRGRKGRGRHPGEVGRAEDAGFPLGDEAADVRDESDDVGRLEKGGDAIGNVVVVLVEARVELVDKVNQRHGGVIYVLGREATGTGRGERVHEGLYSDAALVVLYEVDRAQHAHHGVVLPKRRVRFEVILLHIKERIRMYNLLKRVVRGIWVVQHHDRCNLRK